MRHAPPVRVQCRGRGWRLVQAAVTGLCAGVVAVWLVQHLRVAGLAGPWAGSFFAEVVGAAAAALAAGAFVWQRLRLRTMALCWDGQAWSVDGQPVAVRLAMDLGFAVALCWRPAGGSAWQWTAVSPRDAGAAWHGLRTALHAHATGAPGQDAAWR